MGEVTSGPCRQRRDRRESFDMSRSYLVVEGHGELRAALNLVTRLWHDLRLDPQLYWAAHWFEAGPGHRGDRFAARRENRDLAFNLRPRSTANPRDESFRRSRR